MACRKTFTTEQIIHELQVAEVAIAKGKPVLETGKQVGGTGDPVALGRTVPGID